MSERRRVLGLALGGALTLAAAWPTACLGAATDFHNQGGDACAICHSLASAKGWIDASVAPGTTNWAAKAGAAKCYSCHQTGSATGARSVYLTAMGEGGSLVHLYRTVNMPPNLDGTAPVVPARWVQAGGEIDCITCHNVHSRTNRPYLAHVATMDELCDECHRRGWGGFKGALNTTAFGRSTHPEGVAYAFSGNNGEAFPSAFVYRQVGGTVNITKSFGEALPADFTQLWNLGGHLRGGATGNIECQTCHAVHGGEDYPVVAGAGRPPEPGLLVAPIIGNPAGAVSNATPKASICQACHKGGDAGETVQPATPAFGTPVKDHPVGARALTYIALNRHAAAADDDASNKTGAGTGWARYWANDGTHNDVIVCVTCHDVHGGLGGTPLFRKSAMLADGVTPQTAATFCETCHVDCSPLAHHSNTLNWAPSSITCSDCHGSVGSGGYQAHGDFFQVFYAPAANATRTMPNAAGTVTYTVAQIRANTDSALCGFCHDPADPTNFAIANAPVSGTALPAETGMPSSHGTDRGNASHYLGADTNQMVATDFKLDAWPGSLFFSKYGGATGGGDVAPQGVVLGTSTVICESCHNVRHNDGVTNVARYTDARKAGYESNLLLQLYREDFAGTGDGVDHTRPDDLDGDGTGSELCRGCHYPASMPLNEHHPVTGETVGSTAAPLNTDALPVPTRASAAGAPNLVSYPRVDALDCDSCHRPHDADDDSNVPTGVFGKTRPAFYTLEVMGPAPARDYSSTLCTQCHGY